MKVFIVFLSVLSLVKLNEFEKCGETEFNAPLVVHGKKVWPGEFPFVCALQLIETDQVFCGGTLVTSKHVITAAHCMRNKGEETAMKPEELLVLLGRYNLNSPSEPEALREPVIDITIHPQWNISTDDYDSDIAVITLKYQIVFSKNVRPVCFPAEDDIQFNADQIVGTVVGWGATDGSRTTQDKLAKATVTSRRNDYCFLHRPQALILSSNRTFCAIGEDTGPCSGDSGGGFFEKIHNSWIIRGIISATTIINSRCDLSQYAIYTNIGMFYDWIKQVTTRTSCSNRNNTSRMKSRRVKCLVQNVRKQSPRLACGVRKKATGLIVGGGNFDHGDFPWMVAMGKKFQNRKTNYFCGGTVISDRHILTAAHCLEGLVVRDILVVFGAHDFDDLFEVGRYVQSPSNKFVHEDWNTRTDQFEADIAMLLMAEKIIFSTFVQPICLWKSETEPATIGITMGWGQSQNTSRDHEKIPTMLQLPIHTNEDCFLTFPHLAVLSSNRTFCAGSADGRGPCNGDSGFGFYVSVENVFYLKGIISAAWDVNMYGECLLKMYTIYTDVAKYNTWIDNTMKRSLN